MRDQDIFPSTFGVEYEPVVCFGLEGHPQLYDVDGLIGFQELLHCGLPDYLKGIFLEVSSEELFTTNGFRLYMDGNFSDVTVKNLEISTPECPSLESTVEYTHAGQRILTDLLGSYMLWHNSQLANRPGWEVMDYIRINQRARLADGIGKGTHDNFALGDLDSLMARDLDLVLNAHLSSRQFIVGSGMTSDSGFWFSQKDADTPNRVVYHTPWGELFRFKRKDEYENEKILEIRNSDPNISEWQTWMRLGSVALMLGMLNVPAVRKKLVKAAASYLEDCPSVRTNIIVGNRLSGVMDIRGVEFQRTVAELALSDMQIHDALPDTYFNLALEWSKFTDDFQAALSGEVFDFSALTDRVDWAMRLQLMQQNLLRQRGWGMDRLMGDMVAIAEDHRFDMIELRPGENRVDVTYGKGHAAKELGLSRRMVDPRKIVAALRRAPNTRARLRGDMISQILDKLDDPEMHDLSITWKSFINNFEDPEDPVCLPDDPNALELDAENAAKFLALLETVRVPDEW